MKPKVVKSTSLNLWYVICDCGHRRRYARWQTAILQALRHTADAHEVHAAITTKKKSDSRFDWSAVQ